MFNRRLPEPTTSASHERGGYVLCQGHVNFSSPPVSNHHMSILPSLLSSSPKTFILIYQLPPQSNTMASKKPTPKKTGVYNLDTIASKAAMKRVKKKTTTERKLTGGRTLGGTNEPTPQSKVIHTVVDACTKWTCY